MTVATAIFLAIHLLGMATIVGTFVVQMRAKSGFRTGLLLGGAITQLVSGIVLWALVQGQSWFDEAKYGTHAGVALIILIAAIVAVVVQRRGGRAQPWFHTAGGLAVINVLIAILWRQY